MFTVRLDDWLAIYTFIGGELDGHSSVRVTELWPEWNDAETNVDDILVRARELGPPEHGHIEGASHDDGDWCSKCADNAMQTND